ncbi:28484_t:CDS:2, partial [Racocetra persica]
LISKNINKSHNTYESYDAYKSHDTNEPHETLIRKRASEEPVEELAMKKIYIIS